MKSPLKSVIVGIATMFAAASTAFAADTGKVQSVAPLFSGMGELHHPVTTTSREAQRFFDQGLTLCYAFNHPEAIRSFRGALKHDPDCAMAWWGIAYASGPHVNRPMTSENNDRACDAIQKAIALKSKVSPSDQAYIDSMAKRYQAEFAADRAALDKAWAAAMREVAAKLPDDPDAQTILSEAIMDTMPWDYWKSDRSPKPETEEAFAALRSVLQRHPDHPGANHFYIHAVEAGPNPEWGLPAADRLGKLVPQAGHLVHMPSHIYMRVGQYHDAVLANELAVKADRSYIRHCAAQGFYPGVYYPHNEHFLWFAVLVEGRSGQALEVAKRIATIANDNYCGPNKALEGPRFRNLPWLTLARFGRWKEVLAVAQPPSTNDFLIDRAFWHFTRGLAYAAKGDAVAAESESAALAKLASGDEAKKLNNPQFPATGILAVAGHWLAGKAAEAGRDYPAAIRHLEEAVKAEDALPYMEPSYWPIPTRPALGAALLKAGRAAEAEAVFREDLRRWPRNGWGLFGLEASLRAQDKHLAADLVHREFEDAWQRADVKLDLAWF